MSGRPGPAATPIGGAVALSCSHLELRFGGVQALRDVGFNLHEGEVIGLIGPNGAGKSSLINCVTGFYHPQEGEVRIGEHEVIGEAPRTIAKLGVSRTFQQAGRLAGMGALDVMMLGRHRFLPRGFVRFAVAPPALRRAEERSRRHVLDIAESLGILGVALKNTPFEALPYGVRKLVDLGRALACEPLILLMDEPAAGLTDADKETMTEVIRGIQRTRGIAQLLVDHDVDFVAGLAARLVVLDAGTVIAEGPTREVLARPAVIDAYIGRDDLETAPVTQASTESEGPR